MAFNSPSKGMDASNLHQFITLIPSGLGRGQAPPPQHGILQTAGPLQPMIIPISASDQVMSSGYTAAMPATISMTQPGGTLGLPMSHTHAPLISTPIPAQRKPAAPLVNLYKCRAAALSTDASHSISERDKELSSLSLLQQAYQELNSRKIKDPLSSFLPDIPGEFDNAETQETQLLDLVEHKPIGGKEFLPLSGQALLGFRLLPGPLPEQLRIDPPSSSSEQKLLKKRKHKHRNIDRTEDKAESLSHTQQIRMPNDAFSFIKPEHSQAGFSVAPPAEKAVHIGGVGSGVSPTAQQLQAQRGPVTVVGQPQPLGFDKKKKKKNKDRDKKKKEKKKKKHHTQDPPPHASHPSHPSLTTVPHSHPPPPSTTHFSHPHS